MFPNLLAEMARHYITMKMLAEATGIGYETLKDRMSGVSEFRRSEMVAIKQVFPEFTMDYLFSKEPITKEPMVTAGE